MNSIHPLVIIGSGPAGLTAAVYAARANLSPILIEGSKPGGQLMGTTLVENWPGTESIMGPELMMNMIKHAKKCGTEIISNTVTSLRIEPKVFTLELDNTQTIQARTVIIATGSTPNTLGCPGEEEYWGKGVSTCATCDGALYRNETVIVVGGGDSSMEHASFLARNGNKVIIVHIGEALTASYTMQQRIVHNPEITIIYQSTVSEMKGNGQKITEVVVTHQKTGEKTTIATSAVFLAIGLKPNSSFLPKEIQLTPYGYAAVHDLVKTSVPGIFAAGDIQDPFYRQAIVSSGFGCIAALEAERYINHNNLI